jgi:oxygen-dependent protoporphyrinogen oxidase
MRNSSYLDLSDREIEERVVRSFHRQLRFPASKEPDLIRIFRHRYAIPQYERSSEERFRTVTKLEKQYPGLHIAGNLRDGIGMGHRIIQGFRLGEEIQ